MVLVTFLLLKHLFALFIVLYDNKLKVFGFGTVGDAKQDINVLMWVFVFVFFWHFMDKVEFINCEKCILGRRHYLGRFKHCQNRRENL